MTDRDERPTADERWSPADTPWPSGHDKQLQPHEHDPRTPAPSGPRAGEGPASPHPAQIEVAWTDDFDHRDRPDPGYDPARRADVPSRPTVRMPRWVLLTLIVLLVLAMGAVAGTLALRPSGTVASAPGTTSTPTPQARSTSSSPEATASSPAPSPSGGLAGSSTPQATTAATGTPAPVGPVAGTVYVSSLTPVANNYADSLDTGQEEIGDTPYQNSVRFTCNAANAYVEYDVSGYKYFDATIGTPSDATNAAGNTMAVTFRKDGTATELSPPFSVSLDNPRKVHLNLQGSSQLQIACTATDSNHNQTQMDVALGNATLGPS